jgi:acyl-CoA oxidase
VTPTRNDRTEYAPGRPEIVPLLPLALSVWSDGGMSPDEIDVIARHLGDGPLSTEAARKAAASWFDPSEPPTAESLAELSAWVGTTALDDEAAATRSLADLGLALWARMADEDPWRDTEARDWLRRLESALGVLGGEAARRQRSLPVDASRAERRVPSGDPLALRAYLDRDHTKWRDEVTALLVHPELRIDDTLPYAEYRRRVLDAVRFLAARGLGRLAYPEVVGGSADPGAAVAVFETLAYGDLSVLVKFGVQFGLFGGSIHQLGTERHHTEYLGRVGSLDLPGCYAMTETGHGSNVRDLETLARLDAKTKELVISSPSERAGKDWIGNAAVDGRLATVFARLVVAGVDHGVHAVLVPIRDDEGAVLPGVRIEDRGLKLGLNGVDNGRIWFDDVRVPVTNLLDRFASIDEDGRYRSPIPSPGRRFFTMLGTLVAGRVSVAAAAVSASKVGLTIAVRYAAERRQFGPEGAPELPILEYLNVRRALAPRLATTYALHFATRDLQRRFAEIAADGRTDAELEARAAALKAYASEHCVDALQACREVCGGQGYRWENRFAALKADTDVFTTFEGASDVLYQLVAKGLLSRYREELGDLNLWRAVRYLGERAESRLTELNPVVTRRTEASHLLDPSFHLAALEYREARLLRSAATRIRARLRDGVDSFQAVNEVQDHLVDVARAHAERIALEAFQAARASAPTPDMAALLSDVCALYALARLEADRGWYLEAGYMEPVKSRAIRARVNMLCADVSDGAPHLVAGFGIPDEILPAIGRTPDG